MSPPIPVVVTGARGKVGRLLNVAWKLSPPEGLQILRSARARGPDVDLVWPLRAGAPTPQLPEGAVILHLAGRTSGDAEALAENAALTAPLVEAAAKARARGIIMASTIAVHRFGPMPLHEETPTQPGNAYGMAKWLAEQQLVAACTAQQLPLLRLRIGNVAGADALLTREGPIRLDPVPGRPGEGPRRSWIGPITLAGVLAELCRRMGSVPLPPILNIAQSPPLDMAALLSASDRAWHFGPPNPQVVADALLDTTLLQGLMPTAPARPTDLLGEIAALAPHVTKDN